MNLDMPAVDLCADAVDLVASDFVDDGDWTIHSEQDAQPLLNARSLTGAVIFDGIDLSSLPEFPCLQTIEILWIRGTALADLSAFRNLREVTDNLMVAFSVPIWDSDDGGGEVLGVLGMTVELGGFGFEEMQLDESQMVVLVDTAALADGGEGRILQHAELAKELVERGRSQVEDDPRYYLPESRLAQLRELGESKLAHALSVRAPNPGDGETQRSSTYVTLLDPDYRDPLDGQSSRRWLAAFEPVLVKGRTGLYTDTGWVVIVQERLRDE